MPLKWKIFRIICILQLLVVSASLLRTLFYFLSRISFTSSVALVLFTSILLLCVLGINLLNNNYPDEPVEGRQKKVFNRLFLLNFLLLTFLFGFIIAEFRVLNNFSDKTALAVFDLPASLFGMIFSYLIMLILQFIILFGLYRLRLELHSNFTKRKFEFESPL